MAQIRISYVRATFAAGLLAGVRLSLLKVTDLVEGEQDLARSARRREFHTEPRAGRHVLVRGGRTLC
jgi:hypothetical protein